MISYQVCGAGYAHILDRAGSKATMAWWDKGSGFSVSFENPEQEGGEICDVRNMHVFVPAGSEAVMQGEAKTRDYELITNAYLSTHARISPNRISGNCMVTH